MVKSHWTSVVEKFEQQVVDNPDNIALIYKEYQITYRHLNEKANQLARAIREFYQTHYHTPLAAETVIGLSLERSIDLIISILAIFKAGAAYIPLEPTYPVAYLQNLINEAKPSFIITSQLLQEKFSFTPENTLFYIDAPKYLNLIQHQSQENLTIFYAPDHLAYILYTSGSTGQPKGVMIQQNHLSTFFQATHSVFQFHSDDIWTLFHSFSFDFSVWEIWGALLYGSTLVIVSYTESKDPHQFYSLVQRHKVTIISQTPSAWANYQNIDIHYNNIENASLRMAFLGGEKVSFPHLKPWFKKWGNTGSKLINVYGATEATIFSTYYEIQPSDVNCTESIIGHSLPGINLYLLDEEQQPVLPNVTGEIYIGGDVVARGYVKDLPKSPFLFHPSRKHEPLYKTGDWGMMTAHHQFVYIERKDAQIKLHGFRLDIHEIERILTLCPLIADAKVLLKKTEESSLASPMLYSYLVLKQKVQESSKLQKLRQSIQTFCLHHLPHHKIPHEFIFVEQFPTTINGKLDTKRLLESQNTKACSQSTSLIDKSLSTSKSANSNIKNKYSPLEKNLLSIWESVFQKKNIDIDDSFFALGGNSIKALKITSKIAEVLNQPCSINTLFTYPTIVELATELNLQPKNPHKIPSRKHKYYAKASSGQEELWFIHHLSQGANTAYNEPFLFDVSDDIDVTLIKKTLDYLSQRHESLRTKFEFSHKSNNQLLQKVDSTSTSFFSESDAKNAAQLIQEPFDLSQPPLLRTYLLKNKKTLLSKEARSHSQLLFIFHHIIIDSLSVALFFKEFSIVYKAFAQGKTPALLPISLSYLDYAEWQKNNLHQESYQQKLDFWKKQLQDYELLNLPTDFHQTAEVSSAGNKIPFRLPATLVKKLNKLANHQQVSLFVVLFTALNVFVCRLTRQEKILIGIPSLDRYDSLLEKSLGYFVNLLPILSNLEGNPEFTYLLGIVNQHLLSTYPNRDVPFKEILKSVQDIPKEHSFLSLVFVYQTQEEMPYLSLSENNNNLPSYVNHPTAKFDVTLYLREPCEATCDELTGWFEYRTTLFNAETIEQWIKNFNDLLANIVQKPEEYIHQIPVMDSEPDKDEIEGTTYHESPIDCLHNLHQLFEHQATLSPSSTALIFLNETLSYQTLNEQANQIARWIRERYQEKYNQTLQPDTVIGLCTEKSIEFVVYLIGILKAGAAYFPLDPAYPNTYLCERIQDAQPAFILTHTNLQNKFETISETFSFLYPNQAITTIKELPTENIRLLPSPDSLAYIIYTSGTTGRPKGVMIEHKHVINLLKSTMSLFQWTNHETWLVFHSFSFDFSVWELWGALAFGGKAVISSPLETQDPSLLHDLILKHKISVLNQTPLAFLNYMPFGLKKAKSPLRYIILGGEKAIPSQFKSWFEHKKTAQLINMYGITETTVHTTYRVITKADTNNTTSVIGKPLNHLSIYLLDQYGQPTLPGGIGEIYISGNSLARGYWKAPELTQKSFIHKTLSFSKEEKIITKNLRLYKTGDFGQQLPSGEFAYLYRKDSQVKIRGFRLDISEIESTLLKHPNVAKVLVLYREIQSGAKICSQQLTFRQGASEADEGVYEQYMTQVDAACNAAENSSAKSMHSQPTGLKQLLAYYTSHSKVLPEQLLEYAKIHLPSYKIPTLFFPLETFPLTKNGKIDTRQLPFLKQSFSFQSTPMNEREALLFSIWCQVLQLSSVNLKDNFFSLGGDSILAVQTVYEINRAGMSIQVNDLLTHPTIQELAKYIDQTIHAKNHQNNPIPWHRLTQPLPKIPVPLSLFEDIYPASAMQLLMLHDYQQITTDAPAYHTQFAFHIENPGYCIDRFKKALSSIIARHAPLRAVFFKDLQLIHKQVTTPFYIEELSHLTEHEQENHIQKLLKNDKKNLFNLNDLTQPLLRFYLLKLNTNTVSFIMTIHHAIEDGWSHVEFLTELIELYHKIKEGTPISHKKAVNSHKEFIALEKDIIHSKETKSFWKKYLKKVTTPSILKPNSLPVNNRLIAKLTEAREGRIIAHLPLALSEKLFFLAKNLKVSIKTLFLSAYEACLEPNEAIGLIANGRTSRLSEPLKSQGLFWNIVPFILPFHKNKQQQIYQIQKDLISIEPHTQYPLTQLLKDLKIKSIFSHTFNFVYFHNLKEVLSTSLYPDFKINLIDFHDKFSFPFNLHIAVNPINQEVSLRVEYNSSHFSHEQASHIMEKYKDTLKKLVF